MFFGNDSQVHKGKILDPIFENLRWLSTLTTDFFFQLRQKLPLILLIHHFLNKFFKLRSYCYYGNVLWCENDINVFTNDWAVFLIP